MLVETTFPCMNLQQLKTIQENWGLFQPILRLIQKTSEDSRFFNPIQAYSSLLSPITGVSIRSDQQNIMSWTEINLKDDRSVLMLKALMLKYHSI